MSFLKILVPLGVVVFVVVSFLFLDGWPFRVHTPKAPVVERPEKAAPKDEKGGGEAPTTKNDPAAIAADPESAAREELAAAKADPTKYYRAMSRIVLDTKLSRAFREAILPDLRNSIDKLVYSASPIVKTVPLSAKNGDNLSKIVNAQNAKNRSNITPAFLMKFNRLPNPNLRVGQKLQVPVDSLSVHIVKGDFRAYILLGDTIAWDYPVGIGKDDATPEGKFTIKGKTKNPNWTTPDGRVLPYGHPEHIIGSRWMGFDGADGRTTYGIHGTIDEASIGKAESAGCIRMKKVDVEEIFEIIPEGAEVTIE